MCKTSKTVRVICERTPLTPQECGGATQRPAAWCPHAITSSYEGVSTGTQLTVAVLLGHPGLRTGTRFSHLTSEKMKLLAPEDQSQPEEDRSDGGRTSAVALDTGSLGQSTR